MTINNTHYSIERNGFSVFKKTSTICMNFLETQLTILGVSFVKRRVWR